MASTLSIHQVESTKENDWNPFNIPSFEMNSPKEFNPIIALAGCPPLHTFTRAQFANLSIEKKAAYADGVVRGNYNKPWLQNQTQQFNPKNSKNNMSSVGAVAYLYLKTGDRDLLVKLLRWVEINRNNNQIFD